MINFILITLIAKSLLNLLLKNDPRATLNCGLWGFYGKSSKHLDWNKFNILGIFNDKRGGDASGIVYGDNYSHQNKAMKLFVNHISDLKFPKIENTHWAFGHTRKASFGKNQDAHYTQPLLKFNDNEVTNVFCHNGTLHNHKELIKDLELNNTFLYPGEDDSFTSHDSNDSWALFDAMINGKLEILSKYRGGTAFSYYDRESDKLYLWSGASKYSESSAIISEERPLFISEYRDYIWFSSDKQPLDIIDTESKARTFKASPNTLYIYSKGKLIGKNTMYDRSNCTQSNKDSYSGSYSKSYGKSYDYNYDYNYGDSYYNKSSKKEGEKLSLPMPSFGINLIDSEDFISSSNDFYPKFLRGRFWYKGSLINGIKHINDFGEVHDKPITKGKHFEITEKFYFFDGVFINDHDAYNTVCRKFPKNKFSNLYPKDVKDIAEYSAYPVTVFGKDECWYYENGITTLFSGRFRPIFSKNYYTFYDGECLEISDSKLGIAYLKDGFDIEVDDIEEESSYEVDKCEECKGTGLSAIGMNCIECKGTGWSSSSNSLEIESHIRQNDLPFDDGFENEKEMMISKEIDEELAGVLQSVESAKSIIQYHQGSSDKADQIIGILKEISTKLEFAGMPF